MAAIDFEDTYGGAQTTPSYPAPMSGLDWAKGQIKNTYAQELGREGSDEEYLSHLGGGRNYAPENVNYAINNIRNSAEAQNYRARKNQPTAPPPPTPTPTPTTNTGGRPGTGATRDQILAYLAEFAKSHPQANPSILRDPEYWVRRILETHPTGNVDWNYWEGRFMTPEGAPEGKAPPGTGGTTTNIPGVTIPPYTNQFNDPSTRNLENWLNTRLEELKQPVNDPSREALARLLDQQTRAYQAQIAAQEAENEKLKARRAQAQTESDRFVNFARERAGRLQGPAYTGAEQEVFRTQALDPIEADRQATRQRALQEISRRGLDPSSGIAQELLNQVDRGFDQARAGTQNQLAYRQIQEQRSREQEAQQLLAYIPQAINAAAEGDLSFLNALNVAVNQPQQGAVAAAAQSAGLGQTVRNEEQARRQEATSLAAMLQELPSAALQQSLAAIGLAPSPESLANTAIQLYGIGQQNRNQGLSWYETLGMALPYLTGGFGGSKSTLSSRQTVPGYTSWMPG